MQDLPISLQESLLATIEKSIDGKKGPLVAAFDADGTLWNTDIGELFFHYQIKNQFLRDLPEDPWNHYLQLKSEISPPVAYLWLAQINQGHSIEEVRAWSQSCIEESSPLPIFPGQKRIIDYLHAKNVEVYVVTASIKWSVEPAAALYNIPPERVLGVQTKIDPHHMVTNIQEGPITWRQGKVDALLSVTQSSPPFFCSGNTPGDLALLEAATDIRLAMAASDKSSKLYQDECQLVQTARERGWFYHWPQ